MIRMKIAIINENSQATKNKIIYCLKKSKKLERKIIQIYKGNNTI